MATPFLALGWAHKYEELVRDADVPEALLDARTASDQDIRTATLGLWNERETLRARLTVSRARLERSSRAVFDTMIGDQGERSVS
jgi:polysaccharide pyruvyl transferase WcaK-like protein